MFEKLMNNPIIKRYSFSLFRRNSIIVASIIYISLIMLINTITFLYFVANMQSNTPIDVQKLAMTAYPWMLGLSVILLWGMASITPANIIFSQITKGSYDFFEILPLSGRTKATGLLIGTNLIYYPLAAISIILTIQYGMLGGVGPIQQLNILLLFLFGGLFCNTLSVLLCVSSTNLNKKQSKIGTNKNGSIVGIIILALVFGIPIIGALSDSKQGINELLELKWNFYSFKISAILFISLAALYFAGWNFTGAARKLQDKTLPMFTRGGAVKYLISLQFILFGFFFNYLFRDSIEMSRFAGAFAIVLFFIMLAIYLATRRNKKRIIQSIDRIAITEKKPMSVTILKIVNISNISEALILFTVWAIPALIFAITSGYSINSIIIHFCTFAIFTILAASCSEFYILFKDSKWKYHFLITLFFFVYQGGIFLGGILSRSGDLLIFSFPGYIILMFPGNLTEKISNIQRIQALIFNAFIAFALFGCVISFYTMLWQKIIADFKLKKVIDEEKSKKKEETQSE